MLKTTAKKTTAKAKKKPPVTHPTPLDERTSAQVIGEYLAIGEVAEGEIERIQSQAAVDARGIAITFRISEALGIPDAFELAARFREPFALLRARIGAAHLGRSAQ